MQKAQQVAAYINEQAVKRIEIAYANSAGEIAEAPLGAREEDN